LPSTPQNQRRWVLEHPVDRTLSIYQDQPLMVATSKNPLPQDGKLHALLQELKKTTHAPRQESLLTSIVERVTAHMSLTERRMNHLGNWCDLSLKTSFQAYKATFFRLIAEFKASIAQQTDRLEILWHHKILEALLCQTTSAQQVLNGYTYNYFLNALYAQQPIINIKRNLGCTDFAFAEYF
jgi:hypothetical protein